jgi:RHS repeat-associated protein
MEGPEKIVEESVMNRIANSLNRKVTWLRQHIPTMPFLLVFWLIVFSTSSAQAQSPNIQYTQNVPDSAMRSDIRVDPSNLGVNMQIPLAGYPGRAGTGLSVSLSYSSKVWRIDHRDTYSDQQGNIHTRADAWYAENSAAGWTSSLGIPRIERTGANQVFDKFGNATSPKSGASPFFYIHRIHLHMPDGSTHELRKDDIQVETLDFTGKFYAVDGSRIVFDFDTATVYLADGSRYILGQELVPQSAITQYIDRNGNKLTYNSGTKQWTDTLGRVIAVPLPEMDEFHQGNHPVGDFTYSIPGVNPTNLNYIFRWKHLSAAGVLTQAAPLRYTGNYACGGNPPYSTVSPSLFTSNLSDTICAYFFDPVVLYQIEMPNQKLYTFTYNVWGEIDKISYPTGGYEKFVYQKIPVASYITDVYTEANRGVTQRRISPDGTVGSEQLWQYSALGMPSPYQVTITAPDLTSTKRFLHYNSSPGLIQFGFDDARVGQAYEEQMYSATGQMVRRSLTEWTTTGTYYGPTRDPRVSRSVEVILDYGSNALAKATRLEYDADLNVSRITHYDFTTVTQSGGQNNVIGDFADGTPIRSEVMTYLVNDISIASAVRQEYRNRNMIVLPTLSQVLDANDNRVAEVQRIYDQYVSYPLLPYSAVSQWTDPGTYRGNVTTARRWLDMPISYIDTHIQYDQAGSVRKSYDPLNNISEIEYSSTFAYAYPTLTRSPIPQAGGQALVTMADYDFKTGLMRSITDANAQVTSFDYGDSLNRPTSIVRSADGASTLYSYSDTPGNLYVRTQTDLDSTHKLDSYQFFDKVGRPNRSFAWEGGTYIVTDTQYDNMGRVSRISNPYRTSILNDPTINPSNDWATNQYDTLGRVVSVTPPASAAATTLYFGNQVTVTDQAGKQRRSTADALGRLMTVDELNPNSTLYAQTTYSNNARGDLISVSQPPNTARSFTYDSLSRLRVVANPEQIGATTYTYDLNSNLKTKLDPNSITTTYDYDNLNRVTSRTYMGGTINTPTVTYSYDTATNGKGRLASVTAAGVATYNYTSYDAPGRLTAYSQQMSGGLTYPMSYAYNLAGLVTDATYPSNKMIHTEYDAAGRVAGVQHQATGLYYVGGAASDATNRIQYTAHGATSVMRLGNGLWEHSSFNARLQPMAIGLGVNSTDSSKLALDYTYGVVVGSTLDPTQNNSNIQSQMISIGATAIKQTYTYDAVNRLSAASETLNQAARWMQNYAYDTRGNRTTLTSSGVDGGLLPTQSTPAVSSATNRITTTGYLYDSVGNLKNEPGKVYQYDGENRLVDFNNGVVQYVYDGDGRRVKKLEGTNTTVYVYNASGQMIAEYVSGNPQANGISYLTADHLGSTRIVTDASGVVKSRRDYLPFGEEIADGVSGRTAVMKYGATDGLRQRFTSKERDTESGLDYFLARYYGSTQGRFTSPDPLLTSGKPTTPQSWNRYSYVLNNPLKYIDPLGLRWAERTVNGGTEYCWFADSEYDNALKSNEGWRQVHFDESKPYSYIVPPRNGDEAHDTYVLDPNGMHGYTREDSGRQGLTTHWDMQFAIGGLLNGARTGLGAAIDALASAFTKKGASEAAEMTIVRTIGKGENLGEIISEAKGLTFETGNEHALVRLANGQRALVTGGERSIDFAAGQITRLYGHTHPFFRGSVGPSAIDHAAVRALGQRSSWLFEGGYQIKFGVTRIISQK